MANKNRKRSRPFVLEAWSSSRKYTATQDGKTWTFFPEDLDDFAKLQTDIPTVDFANTYIKPDLSSADPVLSCAAANWIITEFINRTTRPPHIIHWDMTGGDDDAHSDYYDENDGESNIVY